MQNDKGLYAESVARGLEVLFEGGKEVGRVFLVVNIAEYFSESGELEFLMGLVDECVGEVGLSCCGE